MIGPVPKIDTPKCRYRLCAWNILPLYDTFCSNVSRGLPSNTLIKVQWFGLIDRILGTIFRSFPTLYQVLFIVCSAPLQLSSPQWKCALSNSYTSSTSGPPQIVDGILFPLKVIFAEIGEEGSLTYSIRWKSCIVNVIIIPVWPLFIIFASPSFIQWPFKTSGGYFRSRTNLSSRLIGDWPVTGKPKKERKKKEKKKEKNRYNLQNIYIRVYT